MVALQTLGKCSQCTTPYGEYGHLKPIGEEVGHPGNIEIRYSFLQCPFCGHVWQRRAEMGLGAHGSFYKIVSGPW